MSKQTINHNQMSFADLGLIEAVSTPTKAPKKPRKAKTSECVAPANNDVVDSLKGLLEQAETIGMALQEKYEANLTAHRIQSRVGVSVDIEDVEALLLAISKANSALNAKN